MIYDIGMNNRVRYSLGESGVNTLYVIGVNPSTACPQRLDSTLNNVKKFAGILGFDSYLMLNLYPQRATDPNQLHLRPNRKIHRENLRFIEMYIPDSATVWAAWGDLIEKRAYLYKSLKDIHNLLTHKNISWIQYDMPTKRGHPKHPARKKQEDRFQEFDLANYLNTIR